MRTLTESAWADCERADCMWDEGASTTTGQEQRSRVGPQHLRRETIGKRGEHCWQVPPGASLPRHRSATGPQHSFQLTVEVKHRPLSAQQAEAGVQAASERSWVAAARAEIVVDGPAQAKTGGSDSTASPEHLEGLVRNCDSSIGRPPGDRRLCRALAADHEATRSNCHHGHPARIGQPYRECQNVERPEEHRP